MESNTASRQCQRWGQRGAARDGGDSQAGMGGSAQPQVGLPSPSPEHPRSAPGLRLPSHPVTHYTFWLGGEGRTPHRDAKRNPPRGGRAGGAQELGARRSPARAGGGGPGKARRARKGSRAAPASLPLHRPHRVADERPPLHGAELLGGGATQALPAPARRQHSRHRRDGGPGAAAPAAGLHLRGAPLLAPPPPRSRNAAGTAQSPARVVYLPAASAIQRIQRPPARTRIGPYSSPTPPGPTEACGPGRGRAAQRRTPRRRRGREGTATRPGHPGGERGGTQPHKRDRAAIAPLNARSAGRSPRAHARPGGAQLPPAPSRGGWCRPQGARAAAGPLGAARARGGVAGRPCRPAGRGGGGAIAARPGAGSGGRGGVPWLGEEINTLCLEPRGEPRPCVFMRAPAVGGLLLHRLAGEACQNPVCIALHPRRESSSQFTGRSWDVAAHLTELFRLETTYKIIESNY